MRVEEMEEVLSVRRGSLCDEREVKTVPDLLLRAERENGEDRRRCPGSTESHVLERVRILAWRPARQSE